MASTPRRAARLVVLDPEHRVLLFRVREPLRGGLFWLTPGGGLEGDETFVEAARRELREETGQGDVEIGPVLWRGTRSFHFQGRDFQQEEVFFLVRTAGFEVDLDGAEDYEMNLEHRWWRLVDLELTRETVYPRDLGRLLRQLLQQGPPAQPLDIAM